MPSFKQRSYKPELLDRDDIPFLHIQKNMEELDSINHWLGGHAITLKGLQQLLQHWKGEVPLRIAEIGCGGGDNLRVIGNWARKRGYDVELTGIDINKECIAFARDRKSNSEIEFIVSDYRDVQFQQPPHILFSSLFCHHFTDEQLVEMLQWMKEQSTLGFFINDLHRHPFAYYSISWLTRAFSRSYLVRNDAPLSVQRGFVRKEWQALFHRAGINAWNCRWCWAFRWLITYRHT